MTNYCFRLTKYNLDDLHIIQRVLHTDKNRIEKQNLPVVFRFSEISKR